MGEATADIAAASSIASIGCRAFGDVIKVEGISAADHFKAAALDRAAQYGDLRAAQTSGQLTPNLNTTLGNIDAIRAAARGGMLRFAKLGPHRPLRSRPRKFGIRS
jgi:hypothetical protein